MKNTDVDRASAGGLRAFVVRHQMVIFVLLTYLISWSFVIPTDGGLISYGPMIAAFIVLAVAHGRRGIADLWKQMTRWRVGWKWWLLAPGVLIGVHLCALMINIALGARIVDTTHVASLPVYLSATCYRCFCSAVNGRSQAGWATPSTTFRRALFSPY
jgi:hypothetical protein